MRQLIANLGLSLISFLAALLIIELLLAFTLPDFDRTFPRNMFIEDLELDAVPNPNYSGTMRKPEYTTQVVVNEEGYFGAVANSSKKIIVMLGDSYVAGYQVNETIPQRLEMLLRKETGEDIQVINLGVPGYGTKQEILFYNRILQNIKPTAVVLVFYRNDILDNVDANAVRIISGYRISKSHKPNLWTKTRIFLLNNMHIANRAYNFAQNIGGKSSNSLLTDIYGPGTETQIEDGWQIAFDTLEKFNIELSSKGIPFLVVNAPPRDLVNLEIKINNSIEEENLFLKNPGQILEDFSNSKSILYLDPTDSFIENGKQRYLFYVIDSHFNQAGVNLFAEQIKSFMLENDMIGTG